MKELDNLLQLITNFLAASHTRILLGIHSKKYTSGNVVRGRSSELLLIQCVLCDSGPFPCTYMVWPSSKSFRRSNLLRSMHIETLSEEKQSLKAQMRITSRLYYMQYKTDCALNMRDINLKDSSTGFIVFKQVQLDLVRSLCSLLLNPN